jgi:hypothetical protein
MSYTKPIILNESKAATVITGHFKKFDLADSLLVLLRSDSAAYEADE